MKQRVVRKQHVSKMCFVCGVKNDFGLQAKFYETDTKELVALINPSEQHQGYPGRMHGGNRNTLKISKVAFVFLCNISICQLL